MLLRRLLNSSHVEFPLGDRSLTAWAGLFVLRNAELGGAAVAAVCQTCTGEVLSENGSQRPG
jgi:hypothetical protein